MTTPLPPERDAGNVLAWSEAELERAPAAPTLALWRPRGTTVAIGTSQSAERDILPEAIRRDGAALLRRASGGGAVVLCEGVLCWEAWAGAETEAVKRGIRATYAALSRPVIDGLRALGIDAFQAGICDIAAKTAGKNRDSDSDGDGGGESTPARKLAGTAQLRRRGGALVHGSLLVRADLSLLARYLPQPESAPEYRAGREHGSFCANAADIADGATMPAVAEKITAAAAALGWRTATPPEELPPDAEELARGKYRTPDWNWRRIR